MKKGYKLNKINSYSYLTFSFLDKFDFLFHGFTLKNKIDEKTVLQKILREKGFSSFPVISLNQLHSDKVILFSQKKELTKKFSGDAILTKQPNLVLTVSVADCVPIFLVNPKEKIVGLIHSGWKGSLLNIVSEALKYAKEGWNAHAKDFFALLAPSIQNCCYEIGKEMAILFDEKFINNSSKNNSKLDLPGLNITQLLKAGVKRKNIFQIRDCTCCKNQIFYSYRKERENAGRMMAFIGMIKKTVKT